MVGIFQYKNGLSFTGIVCSSKESAIDYLYNKYVEDYNNKKSNPMFLPESKEYFIENIMYHSHEIKEVTFIR